MTEEVKQKKKKGGSEPGRRLGPKGAMAGVGFLTVEQEAYCRGRAMGMNVEESLAAANFPVKPITAKTNWEKNPAIRQRIIELTKIATDNAILKTGLDREWVISRLMSVAERCMQAEPVTDKDGQPTGEYTFNASGANTALKMLGDTMGLFKPTDEKQDEFANLSDDDLARIIEGLAAETGVIATIARAEEAAGS